MTKSLHLEFRGETPICLNKHRSITAGNQFAPISSLLWHLYCSPPFPPSCCFPSSPPSSSFPPPRRHPRARGPVMEIFIAILLVTKISIVIKIIIAIIQPTRAGPKGLRAENARAVTGRRCPPQWEGGRLFDGSTNFFYKNCCNSGTESRKIVPKAGN